MTDDFTSRRPDAESGPPPFGPDAGAPPPGASGSPTTGRPWGVGPGGVGPGDTGQFLAAPPPEPRRKPARTALVLGAVLLAVLSAAIGGVVGALVADRDTSGTPVTSALDAPAPRAENAQQAPAGSVQSVAQQVLPSVVMIEVASRQGQGEGSGVVLSSDGLILTNNHVASGGTARNTEVQVTFADGSTARASLVGADPVSDLAVIKARGKTDLKPIDMGSSADLQVGQPVIAIGSPLGLAGTVTTGIVSALNRPVSTTGEGGNDPTVPEPVIDAIQTDAAINPGNSGGALVDGSGRLVGINTAIASLGSGGPTGQQQSGSIGLGFAIPADQARRVAQELIDTGKATYAQIGMTIQRDESLHGARVLDVLPTGPAAAAGIPTGSVVTRFDDRTIDSGDGLVAAVRSKKPGEKVQVTYTDARGGNSKTVEVTLAAATVEGGR